MNILNMQGLSIDNVITPLGKIGVTNQHDKLMQDIVTLLVTKKGTVIGNPTYGSILHTLLFETANQVTLSKVDKEITDVLLNNYNFIDEVVVSTRMENTSLYVQITYTTLNINLSTKLEFNIPLSSEGGFKYE